MSLSEFIPVHGEYIPQSARGKLGVFCQVVWKSPDPFTTLLLVTRDRQTGRQETGRQAGRQVDRQTDRQTGRQLGRKAGRKAGRQSK